MSIDLFTFFRRRTNCVECITSASKEKGPGKVRVKFDNGLRIFEDYNFLYVDDPIIAHVESGSGQRGTPKGIPRYYIFFLFQTRK